MSRFLAFGARGGRLEEEWLCGPIRATSELNIGRIYAAHLAGHLEEESEEVTQSVEIGDIADAKERFSALTKAFVDAAVVQRVEILNEQLYDLAQRVECLDSKGAVIVPIQTFAPEPFEPIQEIKVVVEANDDGYTATLYDANLSMTGDTDVEAVENLKGLIVHVYEVLEREPKLGPGPARQLAVLQSLIRRVEVKHATAVTRPDHDRTSRKHSPQAESGAGRQSEELGARPV